MLWIIAVSTGFGGQQFCASSSFVPAEVLAAPVVAGRHCRDPGVKVSQEEHVPRKAAVVRHILFQLFQCAIHRGRPPDTSGRYTLAT